jgi:hypothetical protein
LPSTWCSLLGLFQLVCSSSTFFEVASWVVFRLKHGGRQCWGYQKILIKSPNTGEESEQTFRSMSQMM